MRRKIQLSNHIYEKDADTVIVYKLSMNLLCDADAKKTI